MKLAIIFSGYGSQFVGMGKNAYDESRAVQEYFEEAYNCLGINFVKLCFASSEKEMAKVENAYISLFLVNISLYSLLVEQGITPDVVAGHGVGRYAAIFAGGGFTFPDALYLLNKYTKFYLDELPNVDAAVISVTGISYRKLKTMCKEISDSLVISISETNTNHAVSGLSKDIKKLETTLLQLDVEPKIVVNEKTLALGLHSHLMDKVANDFKIYLEKVDFKDLKIPFISSVNGKVFENSKKVKNEVVEQINKPLMWTKVMESLKDYDTIVEVGPGQRMSRIAKEMYPDKTVTTLNRMSDLKNVCDILGVECKVDLEFLDGQKK